MAYYRGMTCENVTLKGDKGFDITAYVAKPEGKGPFPGVVLAAWLPMKSAYPDAGRQVAHLLMRSPG